MLIQKEHLTIRQLPNRAAFDPGVNIIVEFKIQGGELDILAIRATDGQDISKIISSETEHEVFRLLCTAIGITI